MEEKAVRAGDRGVEDRYGDILDLDWKGVRRHPHADMTIRAAQFAPFSALSGYEEELAEAARLVDQKAELAESAHQELDQGLASIGPFL